MRLQEFSVAIMLTLAGCVATNSVQYPTLDDLNRSSAVELEHVRENSQGSKVRHLSDDKCDKVVLGIPSWIAPLNPRPTEDNPSPESPYMTPQENWCLALSRSHESPANNQFPGMLPDGDRATYLGNGHWLIEGGY